MKCKLLLFLLLISSFLSIQIDAQAIYGRVYDQTKKQPLSGASVYLNGTSIGGITNENGYFLIKTKERINASLIISYVGYKTVVVNTPYIDRAFHIVLQLDQDSLQEVRIVSDTWTREKKLREFKKQFLGKNKAGLSCIILNEDDLDLEYLEENETLVASSDKPIRVLNNFLGYEISYEIEKFQAKYDQPNRENPLCRFVHYEGSTFYKEISQNPTDIDRFYGNRSTTYSGSVMHFMRSLVTDQLKKEGFKLYNGASLIAQNRVVIVNPEEHRFVVMFKRNFHVVYKNEQRSLITKANKEKPMVVFPAGNYRPSDAIRFDGILAEARLGNQLPLDYTPAIKKP